MTKIKTCLWFERNAEDAVNTYVSLLPGSRIESEMRAPGPYPNGQQGDLLLIEFSLGGTAYQALNGGAPADYGNAASISVACADQAEVDRLWEALTADGGAEIACGWLRDRWGVPWQIVPEILPRLLADPDPEVAAKAFAAMQTMVKLDAAALEQAARG
jgi:predicted 3-demethylubiquinone-9 3-methyltransferase (glyoxalase superfamily)